MSEENVAIVKSSWAGWRQGLAAQMERDLDDGLADRIREWAESKGDPDLRPEEFIDEGDVIVVRACDDATGNKYTFRYAMEGPRIVGWGVE